jgi:uncharacterized protein (TIGR02996 family)
MESDAAALWRAILAAPHDDAPRLVYADYLDETGRPERAEFIRLQCLADRRPDQTRREHDLWSRHAPEWRGELPIALRDAEFDRGFVYPQLRDLSLAELGRLEPGFLDFAPLWRLYLRRQTAAFLRLATGTPALMSLDELDVAASGPAPDLSAFLTASPLDNLSRLKVSGELGDAVVRSMFARSRWPRLRELGLTGNQLTAAGIDSILTNQHTLNLGFLDLSRNPLGDDGARILSMWPGLHNVRNLDLAFTEVGPAGAAALIASPFLPNIRILNLNGTPATRDAATLTRLRTRFGTRMVGG